MSNSVSVRQETKEQCLQGNQQMGRSKETKAGAEQKLEEAAVQIFPFFIILLWFSLVKSDSCLLWIAEQFIYKQLISFAALQCGEPTWFPRGQQPPAGCSTPTAILPSPHAHPCWGSSCLLMQEPLRDPSRTCGFGSNPQSPPDTTDPAQGLKIMGEPQSHWGWSRASSVLYIKGTGSSRDLGSWGLVPLKDD